MKFDNLQTTLTVRPTDDPVYVREVLKSDVRIDVDTGPANVNKLPVIVTEDDTYVDKAGVLRSTLDVIVASGELDV